jgi:guanylate kinase
MGANPIWVGYLSLLFSLNILGGYPFNKSVASDRLTRKKRNYNGFMFKIKNEQEIQKRLARAKIELEYSNILGIFDKVIVNDDLEKAHAELEEFVYKSIRLADTLEQQCSD